jgi:hypothetical protein
MVVSKEAPLGVLVEVLKQHKQPSIKLWVKRDLG